MEATSIQYYKIEPLSGRNCEIWALKVSAILRTKKLFKSVIISPEPEKNDTNFKEWEDKNDEAFGIIINTLTYVYRRG